MKRNNRGFTLIELLAAVVILGILVGISLPAITGMFDNSRKKMYVSDARKLISLAEYKLKSNSSEMEKPDDGDCILISMKYLDSSDFDTPPGGGEYEKEGSYVVVKNENGNLVYAASIVEKLPKTGYKGIKLTLKSTLTTSKATSRVVAFDKDEVPYIETDINRGYINENLGKTFLGLDSKIVAIYNNGDLSDNSANYVMTNIPTIVAASVMSDSDKYFNDLNAVLQLKIEDKDTPKSNLDIFVSIDEGYENVVDVTSSENSKWVDGIFRYEIDFGNLGRDFDGKAVKIYVVVSDPEGNETRKTLTYTIHKNEPPEIDDSSEVTRRDNDVYHNIPLNMLTAKVKLVVSDDINANSDLDVCFYESSSKEVPASCNDYHPYGYYFGNGDSFEYTFHNCGNGKCVRDGSTHYLTAFVKDKYGAVSKRQFEYTFSINTAPEIKTIEVESSGTACRKPEECPVETAGGNREVLVNVTVFDDVDDGSKIKILINDGGQAEPTERSYATQPAIYNMNYGYDGSTRTISVYVMDSEGEASEIEEREYKLYLNKAPKIHSFSIASNGAACLNPESCPPEDGGSKKVKVYLNAEDDVDYENLMVCLSLNSVRCDGSYSAYPDYANATPIYEMPHDYDGSEQIVYAYVRDLYGLTDSKESAPYLLYVNKPPVLDFAIFNSKTNGRPISGSLNTIFNVSAHDDVDNASTLRVQIIEDGVVTLAGAPLSNYMGKDADYRLAGNHDGRQRNIEVRILDSDSGSDSTTMTYDVYEGRPPTIDLFNVYSTELPCNNDVYCPSEEDGNYNAKYIVKASDDIDDDKDISICVSESDTTCDNYVSYSNYLENGLPKEMTYVFNADSNTPYDGTTRTLYLYVKDTDNNIVKSSKTYKLYENKAPVIVVDSSIVKNVNDSTYNYPDITYSIEAEDDLDTNLQIKYCYKKDNGPETCTDYEDYKKKKVLNNDNFFQLTRPNGENFVIYSKVKDSYGLEVKARELSYKVYKDINPIIYQKNIASGTKIYKNASGNVVNSLEGIENPNEYSPYTRLKIKFSVDDPYDTYSVCITGYSSTCVNYQGTYNANKCTESSCNSSRKTDSIFYDKPGFINENDHIELYLFVKDSHDVVTYTTLFNDDYTKCAYYNEDDAAYEYEFDSETTNSTYNHTNPITMVSCAGKCYYYNAANGTTNDVFAMYKARITYTDKFNSAETCNASNPEVVSYDASCDYKDCFYKNDSYVRNAIGTRLVLDDEPWSSTVNNNIYTCTGHYNLYLSSYNTGDRDITLTKTNVKICNAALDNGEYDFDSTSPDPYVRVSD